MDLYYRFSYYPGAFIIPEIVTYYAIFTALELFGSCYVIIGTRLFTSCMNFLQIGRISLLSVAENIMTCLPCGVLRKISCTSLRISGRRNVRLESVPK